MSMRFYQPSESKFVEDFIYQPPWELMNTALATQQKGYDDAMGQASLFDNIDIKYIDTDADRQNVQNIQNAYGEKAQSIVNAIQSNPNEWRKYSKDIRKLQRDLQKDYNSGDISKIQGNYAKYQTYLENSKEARKNDPHRFNAAMAEAFSRYGGNSLNGDVWSQQDIIADPEFNKLLEQNLKELKANLDSRTTSTAKGGYLIDNEYEVEDLSEERLMAYTANKLLADPSIMAWARQSQQWGLGTYFDDKGSMIPLFTSQEVTDSEGNVIGTRAIPNQKSGFYNVLNASSLQAYNKTTDKQNLRADQVALQANSQAFQLAKMREEYSLKDKLADNKYKLNLRMQAAKGEKWAQDELDLMNGVALIKPIGTPEVSYESNLNNIIQANKEGGNANPLDLEYNRASLDYAMNNMGLTSNEDVTDMRGLDALIQQGMKPEQAVKEYLKEKFKGSIMGIPKLRGGVEPVSIADIIDGRITDNFYTAKKFRGQPEVEKFVKEEYEPLLDKLNKVNKKKETWFKESLSGKRTDEMFIPVTPSYARQVSQQVMQNPGAFKIIHNVPAGGFWSREKGGWKSTNVQDLSDVQDVRIMHSTANGAHYSYGYNAEITDSNGNVTQGIVYPKDNIKGSTMDATMKAGLLFDRMTSLRDSDTKQGYQQTEMLNNYLANDISVMLHNMPKSANGSTLIQYPLGEGYNIPIRLEPNGKITIFDEGNPDNSETFNGILEASAWIRNSVSGN